MISRIAVRLTSLMIAATIGLQIGLHSRLMLARWLLLVLLLVALLAGVSTLLGLICLVVAASFAIGSINASPRPPQLRIGAVQTVILWLREVVVAWSILLFLMPVERWLMRRDIPGTRLDLPPVLLIHGYVNNAGALFILWRAIKSAGLGVHTVNLEPVYADIDAYAALIEARLAQIQQAVGGRPVTLVCHSMGGLAARAYLRAHGGARVARVITLGTPHAGTILAVTAAGANGRQMRVHSAWLAELARFERDAWPCPMVSVFSHDDNVVVPQLSAHLAGARNLPLAGIGHLSLPMTPAVAEMVIAELVAAPSSSAPTT